MTDAEALKTRFAKAILDVSVVNALKSVLGGNTVWSHRQNELVQMGFADWEQRNDFRVLRATPLGIEVASLLKDSNDG